MSQKFVIFNLSSEHIGVPINQVVEIINNQEVFKVPNTPNYIEGLINLRGRVYTLINLRKKLNIQSDDFDGNDIKIFLADINSMLLGFIVDNIDEIVLIDEQNINSLTDNTTKFDKKYFSGNTSIKDKEIHILNLESMIEFCDNNKV